MKNNNLFKKKYNSIKMAKQLIEIYEDLVQVIQEHPSSALDFKVELIEIFTYLYNISTTKAVELLKTILDISDNEFDKDFDDKYDDQSIKNFSVVIGLIYDKLCNIIEKYYLYFENNKDNTLRVMSAFLGIINYDDVSYSSRTGAKEKFNHLITVQ